MSYMNVKREEDGNLAMCDQKNAELQSDAYAKYSVKWSFIGYAGDPDHRM